MKQILISEELFTRLCSYHLLGKTDINNTQIIANQLTEKLERMQYRNEYAQLHKQGHNRPCDNKQR